MRKISLQRTEAFGFEFVPPASQSRMRTGRMIVVFLPDRTNDGQLVGVLCEQRKVLGNVQAGDAGCDGKKLAATFNRALRLQIPRVLMSWSSPHKEQDDAFGFAENAAGLNASGPGFGLLRKQFRQRQTKRPQRTSLQHRPTIEPIAERHLLTVEEFKHRLAPKY